LDQRGSYSATYAKFGGIPTGRPIVIDYENWFEIKNSNFHYYVEVEVDSFMCKHKDDPYPMINETGIAFFDKTWLEAIEQHYDIEYRFISGYHFADHNASLQSLTEELWSLREAVRGNPEEMFIKRLMNTWWGRSLRKYKPVTSFDVEPKNLNTFINRHPLVYSRRHNGDDIKVKVIRPILAPWQIPQFGVNVLSWSRSEMHNHIYKIVDSGFDVYHVNTDSLLIKREAMDIMSEKIDIGLGNFKIEHECDRFICLGPKKRLMVGSDGELCNTFGRQDLEWFECESKREK
jgi:hypothetical protein